MVRNDLLMVRSVCKSIVPETRNKIVRGPVAVVMPLRSEPAPVLFVLVTKYRSPPRPPTALAPNPSAPGNARAARRDEGERQIKMTPIVRINRRRKVPSPIASRKSGVCKCQRRANGPAVVGRVIPCAPLLLQESGAHGVTHPTIGWER